MSYAEEEWAMNQASIRHQEHIDMAYDIAYGNQGSPATGDALPYVLPELTPLQKRQKELEAEALERGRKHMREDRARRDREAQEREEQEKREREKRAREEANRPIAPLPTPSPIVTVAWWILYVLGALVVLGIIAALS
ncbi:hypothetical protein PV733_28280 [Streptomyces europaeiscabiei]|uniref:hypothetical protein n=1 Tax=Streptomyces europaeiscabiei TaxID=146819 RepID=UPI0029B1C033|nr:hypothetical protein [Streptomyces europaeiscabiei]MDX3712769.1 hypothetical protein [Streptomyces europaeiscabiei]